MSLRCRGRNVLLTERPFEGALGAKLYIGVGTPDKIVYRKVRTFNPKHPPLVIDMTRDVSVATVKSPTTSLSYVLPAALIGPLIVVWCQVRTHAGDYENDTIYRPRRLTTDGGGNEDNEILGTANVIETQKRDDGGMRLLFTYTPSRDGLQPDTFSLVKITGPGTIAIGQTTAAVNQRDFTIDIFGLTDAAAYTFNLIGHSGAVDTVLVSAIAFTADDDGPGTITGLTAEEY